MLPGESGGHADLAAGGGSEGHNSDLGPDITGGLGAGSLDQGAAGVALVSGAVSLVVALVL